MGFNIDFGGANEYQGPYEQQGADLLPFQGYTYGKIAKVAFGEAKESKNKTMILDIVVEEAEAAGKKLRKVQPVTGVRSDKKKNVIGLYDILFSVYSGTEADEAAAKARVTQLDGNTLDSDVLAQELLGARVWIDVAARKYQRDDGSDGWSTEIRNFVGKKRYDDAAAPNCHHRKNPDEATRPATAAAPTTSNGASAGTATAAPASGRSIL